MRAYELFFAPFEPPELFFAPLFLPPDGFAVFLAPLLLLLEEDLAAEDFLAPLFLRATAAIPAAAATPATAAAEARTFLFFTALAAAFLTPPFEDLEDPEDPEDPEDVEEVDVVAGAVVSDPPPVPVDPFLLPVVAIESSFLRSGKAL